MSEGLWILLAIGCWILTYLVFWIIMLCCVKFGASFRTDDNWIVDTLKWALLGFSVPTLYLVFLATIAGFNKMKIVLFILGIFCVVMSYHLRINSAHL